MTDSAIAVLDIDGTLIDSNYQHALAWYRALRSVGEIYPVWRLHRLMGMGGDQLPTAVGGEDLERRVGDQARERQGKEVDTLLEEMAPLPGARDLLKAIKERGHRLVLASSAQQRHVDAFLDKLDARGITDDWTSSADVLAADEHRPAAADHYAFERAVARSGDARLRAHLAFAMAIASQENQARSTYRPWDHTDADYLKLLIDKTKYEPTAWERVRLEPSPTTARPTMRSPEP